MSNVDKKIEWFVSARYGMFIHFGLYSLIGRGEWAINRERIAPEQYRKYADEFNPVKFNADDICKIAIDSGMRYIVFTTMHHDGFRMYDTSLSDFSSVKTASKRDFVYEIVDAAKKHGIKIGLYHSLNNLYDKPDAVDALEDKQKYEIFIENTFKRIRELMTRYNPVDIMWYDGWWPFNSDGWKAKEMNDMVYSIQPHIIVNGRNGLAGDFGTPEGHATAPSTWRPWEACMTLNDHWGYHISDNNWKSPTTVLKLLAGVANKRGNLLLNIGPKGDGSVPQKSVDIIKQVGDCIRRGGNEALFDTDYFSFDLRDRGDSRNDWDENGVFTAKENNLYFTMVYYPGEKYTLTGLENSVKEVLSGAKNLSFTQERDKLTVQIPDDLSRVFCPVIKIVCDSPPVIYRTGGMRLPNVAHPRYDPCESDILDK